MTGRDLGLNYLRLWWKHTPMASLYLTTFSDAVAYYDAKNPDFISGLGEIARGIDSGRVEKAFAALADQYGDKYPPWTEFGQSLVGAAGAVTAGQIAGDVASGVGSSLKWLGVGVGGYVLIIGLVAAVALLPELRAFMKTATGKLKRA